MAEQVEFYGRFYDTVDGMYYMSFRAISNIVNLNYDGWPSEELKKAYKTFIGKPVFVDHHSEDHKRARGIIIDSEYVENGDDKFIVLLLEIDAIAFPKLAEELRTSGIDSVSMGAIVNSSECSICGVDVAVGEEYCPHIPGMKGQTIDGELVYEICRDITFYEISLVFDPADVTAVAKNIYVANKQAGSLNYVPDIEKIDVSEYTYSDPGINELSEQAPWSFTNEEESDRFEIFEIDPYARIERFEEDLL